MSTAERMFHALVVDDEEQDRHFVRDIFLREGFQVHEATNGREALDHLKRNAYDVIVLDILMPYLDGFEVMRHLKNQSAPDLQHTVVVSRLNLKDMKVFFPGCRVVQKPVSGEDLAAIAREFHKTTNESNGAPA